MIRRYWLSWIQPTEDYRPLTDPPAEGVLGWWCSGYDAHDAPVLCALIEAQDTWNAKAIVATSWPEITPDDDWRFCTTKPFDWVPGDRFPLKPWMVRRMKKQNKSLAGVRGDSSTRKGRR